MKASEEGGRAAVLILLAFGSGLGLGLVFGYGTPKGKPAPQSMTCCEAYLQHIAKEHPEYAKGRK